MRRRLSTAASDDAAQLADGVLGVGHGREHALEQGVALVLQLAALAALEPPEHQQDQHRERAGLLRRLPQPVEDGVHYFQQPPSWPRRLCTAMSLARRRAAKRALALFLEL